MTSTTNPGDRSPEEIEREVDRERGRVADTIDALQEKMSVGNVLDDIFKAVSRNGGEIGQNLARSVRSNPMPVILTGIGLAWLMASSGRSDDHQGNRSRWDGLGEDFHDDGTYAKYGGGSKAHDRVPTTRPYRSDEIGDDTSVTGSRSVRDRLAETAEAISEQASDVAETAQAGLARAGDALHSTEQTIRDRAEAARLKAARMGQSTRHGFNEMLEEQPLVVGALALAVGAAIGGALPRTRTEDDLIGEQSDRLKASAREMAEGEIAKAKKVGNAVVDDAKKITDDLAGDLDHRTADGASLVESAKAKAGEVADRIRETAEDEAKRQKLGNPDWQS